MDGFPLQRNSRPSSIISLEKVAHPTAASSRRNAANFHHQEEADSIDLREVVSTSRPIRSMADAEPRSPRFRSISESLDDSNSNANGHFTLAFRRCRELCDNFPLSGAATFPPAKLVQITHAAFASVEEDTDQLLVADQLNFSSRSGDTSSSPLSSPRIAANFAAGHQRPQTAAARPCFESATREIDGPPPIAFASFASSGFDDSHIDHSRRGGGGGFDPLEVGLQRPGIDSVDSHRLLKRTADRVEWPEELEAACPPHYAPGFVRGDMGERIPSPLARGSSFPRAAWRLDSFEASEGRSDDWRTDERRSDERRPGLVEREPAPPPSREGLHGLRGRGPRGLVAEAEAASAECVHVMFRNLLAAEESLLFPVAAPPSLLPSEQHVCSQQVTTVARRGPPPPPPQPPPQPTMEVESASTAFVNDLFSTLLARPPVAYAAGTLLPRSRPPATPQAPPPQAPLPPTAPPLLLPPAPASELPLPAAGPPFSAAAAFEPSLPPSAPTTAATPATPAMPATPVTPARPDADAWTHARRRLSDVLQHARSSNERAEAFVASATAATTTATATTKAIANAPANTTTASHPATTTTRLAATSAMLAAAKEQLSAAPVQQHHQPPAPAKVPINPVVAPNRLEARSAFAPRPASGTIPQHAIRNRLGLPLALPLPLPPPPPKASPSSSPPTFAAETASSSPSPTSPLDLLPPSAPAAMRSLVLPPSCRGGDNGETRPAGPRVRPNLAACSAGSLELRVGRYRFSGVNVDTLHAHEYTLSGECELLADGSLAGHAEEESRVWSAPCEYTLEQGRWSAGGHLSFCLAHADHRGLIFNPFEFSLDFLRAGGEARGGEARGGGPGDEDEEAEVWDAVGGWWRTADDDTAAQTRPLASAGSPRRRGHAASAGRDQTTRQPAATAGAFAGSFGRIKHLQLVRCASDPN